VVDVVRQNLSEVEILRREKSVSEKMKAAHADQARMLKERRALELQKKKDLERSEIESKLEKERRELLMIQRKRMKNQPPTKQRSSVSPPPQTAQPGPASPSKHPDTGPSTSQDRSQAKHPFPDFDSEKLQSRNDRRVVAPKVRKPKPIPQRDFDFAFSSYRVVDADVAPGLIQQAHRNTHHKDIARSLGYTMKSMEWNRILNENRNFYVRNLRIYLEKQKNNNTHLPS